MRDILFQGKRVDNGEWVEGHYSKKVFENKEYSAISYCEVDGVCEQDTIYKHCNYEVIPETVSEYAGCEDIHGNKIFENHIVKRFAFGKEYYRKVIFQDGAFGTVMIQDGEEYFTPFATRCMCEVVGNVFDNPELLEVQNDQ